MKTSANLAATRRLILGLWFVGVGASAQPLVAAPPSISYDGYAYLKYEVYFEAVGEAHERLVEAAQMEKGRGKQGLYFSIENDAREWSREWIVPDAQFLGFLVRLERTPKGFVALFDDNFHDRHLRLPLGSRKEVSTSRGVFSVTGAEVPLQLFAGDSLEADGSRYIVLDVTSHEAAVRHEESGRMLILPISQAGALYTENFELRRDLLRFERDYWDASSTNDLHGILLVFGLLASISVLAMYGAMLTAYLLREPTPTRRRSKLEKKRLAG